MTEQSFCQRTVRVSVIGWREAFELLRPGRVPDPEADGALVDRQLLVLQPKEHVKMPPHTYNKKYPA